MKCSYLSFPALSVLLLFLPLVGWTPSANASLVGDQVTIGIFVSSGVGTIVTGPTATVGAGNEFVVTQTLGATLLVTHTIDVTDRSLTIYTTATGSGGGGTSIRFTFSSLDSAGGTVSGFQKTSDAQTQVNNSSFTDHSITFDLGFFASPTAPKTTSITIDFVGENVAPVAEAGLDQAAGVGESVLLDGINSADEETPGPLLTFAWTLAEKPAGSTASLATPALVTTRFTPDIPGTYRAELVVTDQGGLHSVADSITVTAELEPAFVFSKIATSYYSYDGTYSRTGDVWDYAYHGDYDQRWPTDRKDGSILLYVTQGTYSYVNGAYSNSRTPTNISEWNAGQFTQKVSEQDVIFGENTLRYVGSGQYSNSGNLLFNAYWSDPDGRWDGGHLEYAAGSVSAGLPRNAEIVDRTYRLQYAWLHSAANGVEIYQGYIPVCVYVVRSWGTYCYGRTGLYLREGQKAREIITTAAALPGTTGQFVSFGSAAADASGRIVFVAYWVDDSDRWMQGVFRRLTDGSVEKLADNGVTTDGKYAGAGFSRMVVDGDSVYLGARLHSLSRYANSGQNWYNYYWWSDFENAIVRVQDDGTLDPVVNDRYSYWWWYGYGRAERSYLDTWNFDVENSVVVFSSWTCCRLKTFSWGTGYSSDYGTHWLEDGVVRKIVGSDDQIEGHVYDWIRAADGPASLEGRSALLLAGDSDYQYSNTTTADGQIQTWSSETVYDSILAQFDTDRDGVGDDTDNCRFRPNADQLDGNGNDIGNVCEDTDTDSVADVDDNCPFNPNASQLDTDADNHGDACDLCPSDFNPDQLDSDQDGLGDACDPDRDNDEAFNTTDNCPDVPNMDQANLDADISGDVCDADMDGDGISNIVDGQFTNESFSDESAVASDYFTDQHRGGRTFGEVRNRASLIITVEDSAGSDDGLIVSAVNGSGRGRIAYCTLKGKDAQYQDLEQGTVVEVGPCASLRVKVLVNRAEVILSDDVVLHVPQNATATVRDAGGEDFTVENPPESHLPITVGLGDDTLVTLGSDVRAVVSETAPGQFEIENAADSTQPIVVDVGGAVSELEPGDVGDTEQLRDVTPPVITPTVTGTLGNGDWYTSDVSVSWGVADPESPVSSMTGCEASVLTTDTSGTTFTCAATSTGGTASQSVTIKRDATPPQVAVNEPTEGAAYTINQVVAAAYSCSDTLSGVESCVGAVVAGSTIDTGSVGTKTFTVTATDHAGNVATTSSGYSVRYILIGLQQPVDNLPIVNSAAAGKTVPVKWQLKDAGDAYISSLSAFRSLTSVSTACDSGAPLDEIEEVDSNGGAVLRYDTTSNQFIYNWATASSWKGKCRKLVLELSDGQKKEALFKFK